jgi:hypothetical protein
MNEVITMPSEGNAQDVSEAEVNELFKLLGIDELRKSFPLPKIDFNLVETETDGELYQPYTTNTSTPVSEGGSNAELEPNS